MDRAFTVATVGLDETRVARDLIWESFVTLIKRRPLRAMVALLALRGGPARFRREFAHHNPGMFPNVVDGERAMRRPRFAAFARALRPHQWVKNFLVFVPIVAAHTVFRF